MVGGFGLVGAPLTLIDALVDHSDATDLTIVSNNIGEPGRGLGKLLRQGRIRRGHLLLLHLQPGGGRRRQRRRDRGDAAAAGDVRRGDPGGRRRDRRLLHAGRRGHAARRGQGGAADRRRPPRARGADPGGRRARLRRPRRRARQPLVPPHGTELQPVDGDRGDASRSPRRARSSRSATLEPESVVTPHLYVDHLVAAGVSGDPKATDRRAGRAGAAARRGRQPRHRHPEPDPRLPRRGHAASSCTPRTACSASGRARASASSTPT